MSTPLERRAEETVASIAAAVRSAGARGAALGLWGEPHGAVLAALAARALGDAALAFILACGGEPRESDDATRTAELLGLPHKTLDLTGAFSALCAVFPGAPPEVLGGLRADLRMAALRGVATAAGLVALDAGPEGTAGAEAFFRPLAGWSPPEVLAAGRHLGLPAHLLVRPPAPPAEPPRAAPQRRDPEETEAFDRAIEALSRISQAITSDQYIEDILKLIVLVTAEAMSSSVCSLWLLDEKENVLRLRATQSLNPEYFRERTLKAGEGVVWKVLAENRPYAIENILDEPIFKEKDLARRMGLVSMLAVPMRVKDRPVGVINLYTPYAHAFTDLQVNLVATVASQAAVAIENTELMVKTKVIQEELEARKIVERAKDLVMKRLGLPSGDDAYKWLRKRSMNTRKSMREVAEAVLLAMEG